MCCARWAGRCRRAAPPAGWRRSLGLPYFALRDRSLANAAQSFDYLTEDQTRLFPAAAFEEIGADLLRLATGRSPRPPTPLEAMLAEDLEAIVFVRVPQLPSSRVWGDFPVAGVREYRARYPARSPPRRRSFRCRRGRFRSDLRDPDLLPPPRHRADIAIAVWAALVGRRHPVAAVARLVGTKAPCATADTAQSSSNSRLNRKRRAGELRESPNAAGVSQGRIMCR